MTRPPPVSYSEGLIMNYTTRRPLAGLGLGIGFLGGCSATGNTNANDGLNSGGQSGGTGGTVSLGSGGTAASIASGGTGNTINGIGGSSGTVSVNVEDGVVPNDDPSNPRITHPACGIGTC